MPINPAWSLAEEANCYGKTKVALRFLVVELRKTEGSIELHCHDPDGLETERICRGSRHDGAMSADRPGE